MTALTDKIQQALYETRILVLAAQIIIGFQFHSAFERGFVLLPRSSQYLLLSALCLMLIVVALLVTPGAYQCIVENGEDSERLHHLTTMAIAVALLPFALSLGLDLYVVTEKVAGRAAGIACGVAATFVALLFWYGLELARRGRDRPNQGRRSKCKRGMEEDTAATEADKINHILVEIRIALPGSAVLLGFHLFILLGNGFAELTGPSKFLLVAGLFFITCSIALLMAPAAYHRLVEDGEDTARFYRFAGWTFLTALALVATGTSADLLVIVQKITASAAVATTAATFAIFLTGGLWFGFTCYRKKQRLVDRSSASRDH